MAESERLQRKLLQRIRDGTYGCDLKLFSEFLEAVAKEALDEKAKKEKAETPS